MGTRIAAIDTHQFGIAQSGAVYVLAAERLCLIESGTATAAPIVREALGDASPDFAFLTHIHLDHAGGAGHLARAFPACKIVVHERGARHLINPTRLIDGVRSAAPDLYRLYGDPVPIPENQILPVRGGEIFELGGNARLEVVASPGHAPHHLCFFEHASRTLFTGDAAGNWKLPVDVPLTVPPKFDLAQARDTLRRLRELHPSRLAFTHYGLAEDACAILDRYERQLIDWFAAITKHLQEHPQEAIADLILSHSKYQSLSDIERKLVAMCVGGAILSLQSDS